MRMLSGSESEKFADPGFARLFAEKLCFSARAGVLIAVMAPLIDAPAGGAAAIMACR
jgi:hypothetical protein